MNDELMSEYREHAWKYFSLHADQRLKAFNFFILFATLLIGAFATLVEKSGIQKPFILLPLSLIFISFVFWKLEERTRMLVKNGENAIKYIDKLLLDDNKEHLDKLALFSADDQITKNLPRFPLWTGHFSYSRCFRWVYTTCSILGAMGTIACLTL